MSERETNHERNLRWFRQRPWGVTLAAVEVFEDAARDHLARIVPEKPSNVLFVDFLNGGRS